MYLDLTNRQIKILEFIKDRLTQKGYPPSVREICTAVGLSSTSTVHSHLNKLEKLGYIKRDPTKPRTIEVLNCIEDVPGLNQEIIELPVIEFQKNELGIEENIIENINLPANLVIGKDNFIFKAIDDKLVEIGVLKNDYIIVDRTKNVSNGNIVMGIVENNELILGKYFKNENNTKLEFQNDLLEPLILQNDKFDLIGQIRGYFGIIK